MTNEKTDRVATCTGIPVLEIALTNINIDDVFQKAAIGDPLPIPGLTIDIKLHRSSMLKISKSLKRVFKECSALDDAAKDLLIYALSLSLEQYAACATVPQTKEEYKSSIASLEAELKSCEGDQATNKNVHDFDDLITEFAKKAQDATETRSPPTLASSTPIQTTDLSNTITEMMHVDERDRPPSLSNTSTPVQPHYQQAPITAPLQTPQDPRADLKSAFQNTIVSMSVRVMQDGTCNDYLRLTSGETDRMADMLENAVFNEALRNHQQTPLSEYEQLQEYVRLGNEYLTKLQERNCFLTTVADFNNTPR